jgi:hypothetical protein
VTRCSRAGRVERSARCTRRWSGREPPQSRRRRSHDIAGMWLAVLMTLVTSNSAAAAPPNQAGAASRQCVDQALSCEQLVSLGLTYPYPRPAGSYLFVNGVAYPFVHLDHEPVMSGTVRAGDMTVTARALLERLGLVSQAAQTRLPVIAYGSNANVDALTRKFVTSNFSGPAVIPVTRASLRNFDVAWSPELVANGAMPATIVPSAGTTVSVWITWLNAAELAEMNATEDVGTLYSYGHLGHAQLSGPGPPVDDPGLYVDCDGALRLHGRLLAVSSVPARDRHFPAADSPQALRMIERTIGWHGSVYDLVLDNVRSPGDRARRSSALKALAVNPRQPGYTPIDRCGDG